MASKIFEDRILNHYLPEFCHDRPPSYDPTGFQPHFHEITDFDAQYFLEAMDAGLLVKRLNHPKFRSRPLYWASQNRQGGEQLFWEYEKDTIPRPLKIWVEPIMTIATLGRLHFDLGWPAHLLGTQSVEGAFDAMAFSDGDLVNEYIACEIKKTRRGVDNLIKNMRSFGAMPPECKSKATEKKRLQQG